MNTVDLDRLISRYVKSFDGVFSSDRLPWNLTMLVSNTHPSDKPENTGSSSMSAMMEITENSLTRLAVLQLITLAVI